MNFLEINGAKINYEKEGSGPPIFLLHGHGGNLNLFDNISKKLKTKYMVIRYDQRGYGFSDKTSQSVYSTELWADDLYNIMKKLDINKAIIAGHSMSGRICTYFNKKYSENVIGLVTFNTTWFGSNPKVAESLIKNSYLIEKEGIQLAINSSKSLNSIPFSKKIIYSKVKNMLLKNEPVSYAKGSRAVALDFKGDSRKDILDSIKIPTLIIIGDRDSAPLEGAILMHNKIQDSRLAVLPYSGHYSILEKKSLVYNIFKNFLDEIINKI